MRPEWPLLRRRSVDESCGPLTNDFAGATPCAYRCVALSVPVSMYVCLSHWRQSPRSTPPMISSCCIFMLRYLYLLHVYAVNQLSTIVCAEEIRERRFGSHRLVLDYTGNPFEFKKTNLCIWLSLSCGHWIEFSPMRTQESFTCLEVLTLQLTWERWDWCSCSAIGLRRLDYCRLARYRLNCVAQLKTRRKSCSMDWVRLFIDTLNSMQK